MMDAEKQMEVIAGLEAGSPAKPFDFDALFADTRQTVEYWQARCELLEGEIAAVKAERRWIPVDERLPELMHSECVTVIGLWDGIEVDAVGYNEWGWFDIYDGSSRNPPTHWQPLPGPPEVAT